MRTAIETAKKAPSQLGITRAVVKAVTVALLVAATVAVVYLAR